MRFPDCGGVLVRAEHVERETDAHDSDTGDAAPAEAAAENNAGEKRGPRWNRVVPAEKGVRLLS
jgi:hypothetical protein